MRGVARGVARSVRWDGSDRSDRPDWDRDGHDWPNRELSRFVSAGAVRFHVQIGGRGPCLLLLHGTGGATHSWRDVLPRLLERYTVVAPDLPGHGFTSWAPADAFTLPGMADSVARLVAELAVKPALVVGHSAGAAVGLRLVLDDHAGPAGLVSFNGAFLPFSGVAARVFSPAARLLHQTRFASRFVAWRAKDPAYVEKLIVGTGSHIDARGLDLYGRLARCPGHVAGAVAMMAAWDLEPLGSLLSRVGRPLTLVAGTHDRAVPPGHTHQLRAKIPNARVALMHGEGHLAHEERPEQAVSLIDAHFAEVDSSSV